ncbi:MAG TPA: AEC family transporter [Nitrospirota bacterium]|nr:AEC family transporter [Nitrospirota bacterium]
MNSIPSAIVPILVLILLGYALKRARFLPDESWPGMEKLTYFILFPSLLVRELANQKLSGVPWPSMLIVALGALLTASAAMLLWRAFRPSIPGPTFTSIFQGGVRFNTYIALAVAQALFGSEGLQLASVAAGFMIVIINILCVAVLSVWGRPEARESRTVIREIIANPLIIGCVVGWLLSVTGIGLSGIPGEALNIVSRAALPFGLLAVGAALRPGVVRGHLGSIAASSAVQFGIKPLTAVLLVRLTGLTGAAGGTLLLALTTPTAPTAYILARQLGGETDTMASIITAQTVMAFLVMPVWYLIAFS